MRLSIEHTTHYTYEEPMRHSTQYLRLVPRSDPRQRVLEWRVDAPGEPLQFTDGYGNITHLLTLSEPVLEILIRTRGVVETMHSRDEPREESYLSPLVFLRSTPLTHVDDALCEFAERYRQRAATVSRLRELATSVRERVAFMPGVTESSSTAADAFRAGSGVCQDHAHVFIACCHHLGIPARYVSGYLYLPDRTETPVASHAWAEAWIVDRWRSFDITNDQTAGERHIRLAIGADYLDAAPVRGVRNGGGKEQLFAGAIVTEQ